MTDSEKLERRRQGVEKRRQKLLERHGGPEGLKQYYRDLQKKSRLNYNGKGGLLSMSEERRKEISKLGVEKRRANREAKQATQGKDELKENQVDTQEK